MKLKYEKIVWFCWNSEKWKLYCFFYYALWSNSSMAYHGRRWAESHDANMTPSSWMKREKRKIANLAKKFKLCMLQKCKRFCSLVTSSLVHTFSISTPIQWEDITNASNKIINITLYLKIQKIFLCIIEMNKLNPDICRTFRLLN